jgi:hypothetical protein
VGGGGKNTEPGGGEEATEARAPQGGDAIAPMRYASVPWKRAGSPAVTKNWMIAESNALRTTPVRRSAVVAVRPRNLASPKRTTSVAAAPANAARGRPRGEPIALAGDTATNTVAPRAAPPEIPRMNGSARGLRRTAW